MLKEAEQVVQDYLTIRDIFTDEVPEIQLLAAEEHSAPTSLAQAKLKDESKRRVGLPSLHLCFCSHPAHHGCQTRTSATRRIPPWPVSIPTLAARRREALAISDPLT